MVPKLPLTRYVKLRVALATRMPGTFSPPPRVSDPDMHHATCVAHVSWCMLGSLTSGFHWSRLREKHSRHSRRMLNPQFYVSGKRSMSWHHHEDEEWGHAHAIDPETRSHKIITSTPFKAVFGYLTNKAKQNKNKHYHCHDKWPQATITDWWHCAKFKWQDKCRIGQNDRQRRRQICHMLSNCIIFFAR